MITGKYLNDLVTTKFNVFKNLNTPPTVKDYTTIEDWFNLIKSSDYTDKILEARQYPRKSKEYDKIKNGEIPCITYNFTFHTYKLNDNISGSTGLIYIDIDDDNSFDINSLDKSKIYAYHKSFGGSGYVVLVQVKGLTYNNYKSTYQNILKELGLSKYYDKSAVKATQFNVLSYDPNIFINYDSFVFSSINDNTIDVNLINDNIKCIPFDGNLKKQQAYTHEGDTKLESIRYDNTDEISFIGDYIENRDGFENIVKCFIPIRKITSNRNDTLLAYTTNLVWLNPHLTIPGTLKILKNVNSIMCATPVDDAHLKRIVTSVFKYKEDGTLQPILWNKKRKLIFAKDAKLDVDEKKKITCNILSKWKADDSKAKLYDIIEKWDFDTCGKITVRAIIKYGNMSNKTIVKYWPEFKDYVAELNTEFKANRSPIMKDKKQDNTTIVDTEITPEIASNEATVINMNKKIKLKYIEYANEDAIKILADDNVVCIANYSQFKSDVSNIEKEDKATIIKTLFALPDGDHTLSTCQKTFDFYVYSDGNTKLAYYNME